ncbi:MAG: 3-isopropylmalate dehydratase small subunit [Robiginitomaculum sp.]|nr:MAG: 3-isopropylmalate dehydratase small subunit [Robiginitomaculum sp.]
MSLDKISRFTSKTMVLEAENIDTDQIIPARFLTTTVREGLGKLAFYDWRYNEAGLPVNSDPFAGKDPAIYQILVGGDNFGCGSSREHAPWALVDFGFRAIISTKIADIFKNNALKNGLLPIEVEPKIHAELLASPGVELTIDLERREIIRADHWRQSFDVDPFGRQCLLDGIDPLGFLQSCEADIEKFEARQT